MAAVFIDLCSLAVGAEYEILQFLVVESTLLTRAVMFDPQDSLPDCWGDQGSCELALGRTGCSSACHISTKPS